MRRIWETRASPETMRLTMNKKRVKKEKGKRRVVRNRGLKDLQIELIAPWWEKSIIYVYFLSTPLQRINANRG